MGEVAFFGDGSQNEEVFPEELLFDAHHISTLLQSLRYEETKEVDLLETFTKMLTELHPESEIKFGSMLDILETCTVLLEKQTYPVALLDLLATFAMRKML